MITALLLAVSLPQGVGAHLREAAVIRADYVQVRTLAALSRPLKSSGTVLVARDRGVVWTVARPFAATYVVGPAGLTTVDAEGRVQRRTARELPILGDLGRMFPALVSGDWKALEAWFQVAGSGDASRWSVDLRPKAASAGFPRRIRIQGGRYVEKVLLEEAGGDTMEIAFSRSREGDLGPAETRLLAQE